ncbi:MAG: N-acetylmuramoyl-L-alanine amidase [Ferruginibacter sp.]
MNRISLIIILFVFAGMSACSRGPYYATNKQYREQAKKLASDISATPVINFTADSLKMADWVGTVNFGIRKPNFVIIHHTAQKTCEQTLKTFTMTKTQVSAHYVICKDGTVYHMLNDYLRAWHAGTGKWGNLTDVNSASIGIEIDNDGTQNFTEAQLNSLMGLLSVLKKSYGIPAANFIGHSDIAPVRKVDPNVTFPWNRLAEKGYGLWYGDTTQLIVPVNFDSRVALKVIGYDISNLPAATAAFRRHFLQQENTGELRDDEKKILFALFQKSL